MREAELSSGGLSAEGNLQPQGGPRWKWRGQRSEVTPFSVLGALLITDTHSLIHCTHTYIPHPQMQAHTCAHIHTHTLQQGGVSGAVKIPFLVHPLWAVSTGRRDSLCPPTGLAPIPITRTQYRVDKRLKNEWTKEAGRE